MEAEAIVDRCVLAMANEAVRCLAEEVVDGPRALDLATVFGTGFAPFRGGVLRYVDARGPGAVVERLEKLRAEIQGENERLGRYEPAPLLAELARAGKKPMPPSPGYHEARAKRREWLQTQGFATEAAETTPQVVETSQERSPADGQSRRCSRGLMNDPGQRPACAPFAGRPSPHDLPYLHEEREAAETTAAIVASVAEYERAIDPTAIDHAKRIPDHVLDGLASSASSARRSPRSTAAPGKDRTYARVMETVAHRCASTVTVLAQLDR
jgi:hypothetical protein